MIQILVILALCWGGMDGYRFLQDELPNGDRVPHPCKANFMWEGVGHKNVEGGGDRNPFGKDFAKNGKVWNECICRRDSDGDGRTNGEELGDPDCVWRPGAIPAKSNNISHPGVCEPVRSPYCATNNDWDFCDYEGFDCSAVKEDGIEEVTIKFDKTTIPAVETSYYCMTFDLGLDPDVEYHMIGAEPIIDNKDVMHHIVVMGCQDGLDDDMRMDSPQECGMLERGKCSFGFSGWTVGSPGQCVPPEYGFKAGKGGVKAVIMQFHWNNPKKISDYTDESGMRLYFTRKLRSADGAVLTFGAASLKIPPGMTSLDQHGYCTSDCSMHMPKPIMLSSLSFHMHYLGRTAKIIHSRNGEVLRVIEEENYSYDSPIDYNLDTPIEFRPGDEMELTCGFKSTSRSRTTYFGLGTSDEMCFAFFYYYPAVPKLSTCASYLDLDICLMPGVDNKYGLLNNNCDFGNVTVVMSLSQRLKDVCTTCNASCKATVDTLLKEHPCLMGDVQDIFEHSVLAPFYGEAGVQLVENLHRCDNEWDSELFYVRAGRSNYTHNDDAGKNRPTERPHMPSPGRCVFDLDDDYGVAGAGLVAPLALLVAMSMLLTTTEI